ncbi:hypothetical protein [Vibrio metschnikovii]|uniref:hypothetical protein n=1 Tax=Vibrio metschnikovii TaxID=28172 RepID=UPI001C2F1982|nr:hypothetical protein [Vibrio metschnikovii]
MLKIYSSTVALWGNYEGIPQHETRVDYIKAKTEQIHTENRGKGISDDLRKEMADKTFAFMERFSVFSAIVLWIYISLHLSKGNPIPENVMIALITTTFVTVIGLVGFILKGLFGTK